MYLKVAALPNFGELISYRRRYMEGKKMNQQERRYTEKILNEDIIHYMDQKRNDVSMIQEQKTRENMSLFKRIQEKNKNQ
jgi:hypothetical protein